MRAAQVGFILEKEKEKYDQSNCEEPCKPVADGRLGEGMDGADDSAAGEKGSENGKPEGGEDQPHVPHLQHAAFFLHHGGVQEGGAGEPGHERRIFNRIPSPVAAPTEHGVGPVSPEKNSAGEERPGMGAPAAGKQVALLALTV